MSEQTEKKAVDPYQLDPYDYHYHKKFNQGTLWERIQERIGNFLCFCAGADTQILDRCPHSERVKEQGIGGVVFATATLAFLSGSYAFYTVFSPKPGFASAHPEPILWYQSMGSVMGAIVFGVVWSLVIFNLDRFIVSSGGHGDGTDKITWGEFGRAIPRLVMAVVIGLVLSKPLEIRIMQTEIESRLRVMQDEYVQKLDEATQKRFDKRETELKTQRDKIAADIAAINDQRKKYRDLASQRQNDVIKEQSGESGAKAGVGKRAENADRLRQDAEKQAASYIDQSKEELADLTARYNAKQKELKEMNDEQQLERNKNRKDAANQDGLIMRILVAHEVSPIASWALTALLMVLEIAPIFFKMMLTFGPYDYFVENQKRIALAARGIRPNGEVKSGDAHVIQLYDMIYEQAERAKQHEGGKLQIERKLTQIAQERFEEISSEDIRQNPKKYLANGEPANG
jgi:hypothetical protein